MIPYLIFMLSPIILSLFFKEFNKSKDKIMYLILYGIILSLMIGLRSMYNGSTDSIIYSQIWRDIGNIPISGITNMLDTIDLEKGYLLSVWILTRIFSDTQFQFIFSGMFFAYSICYFVYKNSRDLPLSLLMFNCLGLFNFFVQGLRQSIAMCICLLTLEQVKKRRIIPFLLLICIAAFFHGSAIIYAVVYFIYPLKVNFKTCIKLSFFSALSPWIINIMLYYVNMAMNEEYTLSGNIEAQGGGVAILIYILILLIELIHLWNKNEEQDYNFFFYYTLIGFIAFAMRGVVGPIIDRINMYFMFGQMILLPDGLNIFNKKSKRIIKMIIIILCFGIAVYKASYSTLIPYEFFWQYK